MFFLVSETGTNIFSDIVSFREFFYSDEDVRIRAEFDAYGDELVDYVTLYEYDESGRLIRRLSDNDQDNIPENATTFRYGQMGEITRSETDRGNNGSIDSVTLYSYEMGHCDRDQFGLP